MCILRLELTLIIIFSSTGFLTSECPTPVSIQPCVCDNTTNVFKCKDTKSIILKNIFTKASATMKHKILNEFTLENSLVEKLQNEVFLDVHFKGVNFINCSHLTGGIGGAAFQGQEQYIENLVFDRTPIVNNGNIVNDIFAAVSRLIKLVLCDLSGTQLTTIPDDAFEEIHAFNHMKRLYFCKDNQKCRSISKIGKKAFYYLYNIELIDLSRHRISFIQEYTFALHNMTANDNKLHIILDDNELNGQSFDENAFLFIGRPVFVSLNNNRNLTFLSQNVFEPFLNENNMNSINVTNCPIDWNSENMLWIKDVEKGYKNRIHS